MANHEIIHTTYLPLVTRLATLLTVTPYTLIITYPPLVTRLATLLTVTPYTLIIIYIHLYQVGLF